MQLVTRGFDTFSLTMLVLFPAERDRKDGDVEGEEGGDVPGGRAETKKTRRGYERQDRGHHGTFHGHDSNGAARTPVFSQYRIVNKALRSRTRAN